MPVEAVWRYVSEHLEPYAPLEMDTLRAQGDAICLHAGRGEPVVRRYLDGTVSGCVGFELRARSRDRLRAWRWLQRAADHFAAGAEIPLAAGRMFGVRVLCAPCLVERDEGGWVYGAQFEMEYDEVPGTLSGR